MHLPEHISIKTKPLQKVAIPLYALIDKALFNCFLLGIGAADHEQPLFEFSLFETPTQRATVNYNRLVLPVSGEGANTINRLKPRFSPTSMLNYRLNQFQKINVGSTNRLTGLNHA